MSGVIGVEDLLRGSQSTPLPSRQSVKPTNPDYDRVTLAHWMAKTTISDTGCWRYYGFVHKNGYGSVCYRGKNLRVHRASFAIFKGPIPSGHDVCHTCDIRNCWNPDHLFSGPRQKNHDDMWAKGRAWQQKETCCHGHPWSENALYRVGTNKSTGKSGVWRHCRECYRLRQRTPEYRAASCERQRRRRAAKRAAQELRA
jgi:hypothetical protein